MTLFEIGTLWFYVLLIIAYVLITLSLEIGGRNRDAGVTWSTTVVLLTIVLLFFGGARQPFVSAYHFLRDTPVTALLFVLSYIVLGIIWSFVRWYLFLVDIKNGHSDYWPYDKSTEQKKNSLKGALEARSDIKSNKNRVIAWMIYWPFSALWCLMHNPVRRLFTYIFNEISGAYTAIAKRVVSKALSDFDNEHKEALDNEQK